MNNIKILTDNSCDLSMDILDKYNIGVIGLNVNLNNNNYIDLEMDKKEFYRMMKTSSELPKTSCPSPEKFAKEYDCKEENLIVFTLTSKLSATYSTAVLAKGIFIEDYGNKNIEIIDTCTGTVAHGLIVLKTAMMAQSGSSMDEIMCEIEKMKENSILFGTLDTLENAVKGGRMNAVAGKVADILNVKALVAVRDGLVKPIGTARGEKNSLKKVCDKILESIENHDGEVLLNIGHAQCDEKAENVKAILIDKYNFSEIIVSEIGPAMGTYTSEGALLVSVLKV